MVKLHASNLFAERIIRLRWAFAQVALRALTIAIGIILTASGTESRRGFLGESVPLACLLPGNSGNHVAVLDACVYLPIGSQSAVLG